MQIITNSPCWNHGIFKHVQSVKWPGICHEFLDIVFATIIFYIKVLSWGKVVISNMMIHKLLLQGLIKLGQSRDDKLRKVTPKLDEGDITFALQVIFHSLELLYHLISTLP